MAENGGVVDIWGPGTQTRSFLYVDECVEAIYRLMNSDCDVPVNIGSEQRISINDLALLIADIAKKDITINNRPGPLGVMGRTSDNKLIEISLKWKPGEDLRGGLEKTYSWIADQIQQNKTDEKRV